MTTNNQMQQQVTDFNSFATSSETIFTILFNLLIKQTKSMKGTLFRPSGITRHLVLTLGLLDQLSIFWQLCLVKLRGHLIGLGVLAVAFDISKAFVRVWHAGLLHRYKCYGVQVWIFGVILSFVSNRWIQVVLDGQSSQEYPVNAGVPQDSNLGPAFLMLYINDLMMLSVMLPSLLLIPLTTLSAIRHLICANNQK